MKEDNPGKPLEALRVSVKILRGGMSNQFHKIVFILLSLSALVGIEISSVMGLQPNVDCKERHGSLPIVTELANQFSNGHNNVLSCPESCLAFTRLSQSNYARKNPSCEGTRMCFCEGEGEIRIGNEAG